MIVIPSHCCKETPIGKEKIAEAVWLYVFKIVFPASHLEKHWRPENYSCDLRANERPKKPHGEGTTLNRQTSRLYDWPGPEGRVGEKCPLTNSLEPRKGPTGVSGKPIKAPLHLLKNIYQKNKFEIGIISCHKELNHIHLTCFFFKDFF